MDDIFGDQCVAEPQVGIWSAPPLDWSDVGPTVGDPVKAAPYDDIQPHHPELIAVHAAHLPSSELILFHGQSDIRLWPIGEPASTMRWHPVPFTVPQANPDLCNDPTTPGPNCYADIFCSGHVVLPDGRFFVAGGNVTGSGADGGLPYIHTYDPTQADENVFPFGWHRNQDVMEDDRWYPTATVIPGAIPHVNPFGRVLIVSGASAAHGGASTPKFELYDVASGMVETLDIQGVSPFGTNNTNRIPLYPFMFLLPNGDIFYAGGEGTSLTDGRVLIPDYNNNGTWMWHPRVFASNISGGSAAMYAPGKIMKSGGVHSGDNDQLAHPLTETINLTGFASGDYASAPNFIVQAPMGQARHLHTLTVLADGRVVATGGNARDNGHAGDHFLNPCDYEGNPIAYGACNDADLDGYPDDLESAQNGCPAIATFCGSGDICSLQPPGTNGNNPVAFCFDVDGDNQADDASCGSPCLISEQCPPGAECGPFGHCVMSGTGVGAVVHCTGGGALCDPANNQCHATRTAEIYDPDCETWTELGAQEHPRMYHSTALLLPDGSVISMGGGHGATGLVDQPTAQLFVPEYGPVGPSTWNIGVSGPTDMKFGHSTVPWNGEFQVLFLDAGNEVADYVTLVRLGSATHGFDMDQRWMRLPIVSELGATSLTVEGPKNKSGGQLASFSAPPGYYMLFVRSESGEVSTGQYVKVGPGISATFACPASPSLNASEISCLDEPIGGRCPTGRTQTNRVGLPRVMGPTAPIDGWHVLVPAGELADHGRGLQRPSARELATINARCVAACEAHYRSDPAVAANCGDPGAFGEPTYHLSDAPGPYDLVLPNQKRGQEVFGGQELACDLDSTCCAAFDEDLCAATPDRTTPAQDMLGIGEEYKIALGPDSEIEIITNLGTYASELTGSVGYSFCPEPGSGACPFYLGSFEARMTSAITASMRCEDGSTAEADVTDLVVKLSQPAFGIASGQSSHDKGFPKGGLLFESAFRLGSTQVAKRRPTTADVVISAEGTGFDASDLIVSMTVPCNASTTTITALLTVRDPGDGSALGKPPVITNTTATTDRCGRSRALTAAVSDPDADAGPVRWKVDGVLMAPGTSNMIVTATHTLEAVVRDSRGATTTAKKVISCF